MSAPHTHRPLPILKDQQARASDPGGHVWLSASAGTGKTQVLTARVFRLLLTGVDPGAILCLTFTKAGAAEMAGRIGDRLAAWVRMPEPELVSDLQALGEDPSPALRARARTLFARVLDSPGGGIRIQTIHGFCQSLLAAFPVEAGLVPGFRPIEAREEAVMARDALAEMLVAAETEGREAPVATVGALSLRLGEGEAEKFLLACARAPAAMAELPMGEGVRPFIRRALDLPQGEIEAEITAACSDDAFDVDSVARVAAANRAWGTATGGNHADVAECWVEADPAMRAQMLGDLIGVPFTAKREPRKYSPKLLAADSEYADLAIEIGEACAHLLGLRERAAYADLLADALSVGRDYAVTYERAKRRLGAVDFDDLIRATISLLGQPGMGEWVRYKLDQATDHVLIDEAQDTNPAQWAIIHSLVEEFFAGEGAQDARVRTLFTVGDFKQAIFGFQGTHPLYFAAAEKKLGTLARDAWEADDEQRRQTGTMRARPWHRLSLTQSFRSTRPVLEFVDAAIEALPDPGLGAIADREVHASEVPGPGTVTLWPLVVAGGSDEDEESWISDSTRELARQIARTIKGWIGTLMLESKGRTLRPEDIMILVKRRGELASLIVARLYAEGVPVAGVDRLRLNAPLSVQDLLAAIRFVLQPADDLSLAALLVSPLIGWSQERLMLAAPPRTGSLWRHISATEPREDIAPLFAMLARADIATPYQFLEELLSGPLGARRNLVRRLGQEARDPIEELLSAALDFESLGTPSLQRFLDWFDRGEVEIKRDPSAPLDAVRVMTAHGAKGLQAPLVILADAAVDPTRSPRSTLNWRAGDMANELPVIRPRKGEATGPLAVLVEETAARDLEEHWRLFYVAATRAEERLVIAGSVGPRAQGIAPEQSWYAAADRAMTALGIAGEGARDFAGREPQRPVAPDRRAARGAATHEPVPDWALRPAPQEARPPRPLAPSSLGEDAVADAPPTPTMRAAAERGRLIHALFERLPAVASELRAAAADRWLAQAGAVEDAKDRARIIAPVLAVLDDPTLAELFGPNALAEAPIAAVLRDGFVVSGTVDRLLVTPELIRVVDFKTGRAVPAGLADVPAYHLKQMAAYVAALAVIFPQRRVEAALLYTSGPTLYALPDDLLAAHKPGFAGVEQS